MLRGYLEDPVQGNDQFYSTFKKNKMVRSKDNILIKGTRLKCPHKITLYTHLIDSELIIWGGRRECLGDLVGGVCLTEMSIPSGYFVCFFALLIRVCSERLALKQTNPSLCEGFAFLFVGAARFELATSWSQTRRDDRATLRPELYNHRAAKVRVHCRLTKRGEQLTPSMKLSVPPHVFFL
jgi:hypothetical protein